MPLSALVNGKKCIGMDIPLDEWKEMQVKHRKGNLPILMIGCNQPGHMVRKNGLQFFRHAPNSLSCDCERGETQEHLRLKYQIYELCKSYGWEADPEFTSPDGSWRADVLSWKNDRKVAFEIQWSPISLDTLKDRDRKYTNNAIESYWLLRNLPYNWQLGCIEKYGDLTSEDFRDLEHTKELRRENAIFHLHKFKQEIRFFIYHKIMIREFFPELDLPMWVLTILTQDYSSYLKNGENEINLDIEKRKLDLEKIKSFKVFVEQFPSIKKGLRYYQQRLDKCDSFFKVFSNYLSQEMKNEIIRTHDEFDSLESEIKLFELDLRNYIVPSDLEILEMDIRKDKILKLNRAFFGTLEKYEWMMKDNENYKRSKRLEAENKRRDKLETTSPLPPQKNSQMELSGFY